MLKYDYLKKYEKAIFPEPFQDFSIKQIVDLGERIEVHNTNHGHTFNIILNEQRVVDEKERCYTSLLCYIKFLSEQMEDYFQNYRQMKILGFPYPDIYTYITRIVSRMKSCIAGNLAKEKRTNPIDIIDSIGQIHRKEEINEQELYEIIDFIELGKDLTTREEANKLKRFIIPKEEIEKRRKNIEREVIDINSYLNNNKELQK